MPDQPAAGQAPGGERSATRAARWATVVVLVLSTGAFVTVFGGGSEDESRTAVLLMWILVYAAAAAVMLDGVLRSRLTVRVPATLGVFIGLAAASVLWSDAPLVSVRRTIGLAGTVAIGLVIAQRLRPIDIFDCLRRAMLIVSLASLLFYLSGDPRALDDIHQTLRGVVATKNSLGRVAAVGLLAAAATAFLDRSRLRRCGVSALVMVATLALTDSAGGTVLALLVLGLIGAAGLFKVMAGRVLLAGAVLLTLGVLALSVPGTTAREATALVGRDATLTGRTELWDLSLDAVATRPLLGHGYAAFWHPQGSPASAQISERLNYPVPHAHNGLIDAALSLGVLGAVVAVLLLAQLLLRGIWAARDGRHGVALLRLAMAALVVVSNLIESSLLRENSLLTLLLVAALAVRDPAARPVPPLPRTLPG